VLVLAVEGEWSDLVAPGVLCCSESAHADLDRFSALVEEAFVSGLDAVEMPLPAYQAKKRPLPPSVLSEPLLLLPGPEIRLVCARVIAYPDGFEIELRRSGGAPPAAVPVGTFLRQPRQGDPWERPDMFVGLHIGLHFADGRHVLVEDLAGPDREGELVLSRFWRKESDADSLWLWVAPLPPEGGVRITAVWPAYGIESAITGFDSSLVRRARAG
jgi:hypothetical protein